MTWLLDVNSLIGALFAVHEHHARVPEWLASLPSEDALATCPNPVIRFPYCLRRIRYYLDPMPTVTVKLPESLSRALSREAERRGVPKSAVIRESLERTLAESREEGEGPSCLDLVADLVGIFDGPPDASTNKAYLFEALEKDHKRGRRHPH